MHTYLVGQEIVSGSWTGSDSWRTEFATEIPTALRDNPRLCTAVGVVVLSADSMNSLPRVLLTTRDQGRGDAAPRWEIPCGHVDPIDPQQPEGALESFEVAGARETLEEGGARLRDMTLFGVCSVTNPAESSYPPQSFMLYYYAFIDGVLGEPTEVGHSARLTSVAQIGELARMTDAQATDGERRIAVSEAKIIRAGLVAAGYPPEVVDNTLGLLPDKRPVKE